MFIVPASSNMGAEVKCIVSQKLNHLASSVCQCTLMLERVKVKLSPQTHKRDRFAYFICGCNCKTSRICHQQTR